MGDNSVRKTSAQLSQQQAQQKNPKKVSLKEFAESIFQKEFAKIDKNGNGIDSLSEAKAFIDWYTNMSNKAREALTNKAFKIFSKKSIHTLTKKVVEIWTQLSLEHFDKAMKIQADKDKQSSVYEPQETDNEETTGPYTGRYGAPSSEANNPPLSDSEKAKILMNSGVTPHTLTEHIAYLMGLAGATREGVIATLVSDLNMTKKDAEIAFNRYEIEFGQKDSTRPETTRISRKSG